MLALESHLASLARSIKSKLGQAILFTKENTDGVTIFVLKDGILKFTRTLPAALVKEDNFLTNEIGRMKASFESDKKAPLIELPLNKAEVRDEYLKYIKYNGPVAELQSKWLVSIGAAIRGEIPKGQDNRISLLSVGTAEAYEYQKTTAFVALIRNMIIGVSIFFLFAFFASYLFIFSISQTINNINTDIPISSASSDIIGKEALIKKINALTLASQSILAHTINWSILIDEINVRTINGIIISSFGAPSVNDTITITGLAKTRDTLNQFKISLQGSTYLKEIKLPITNLEQKADIPFSVSFSLKDPSVLYYK
jgi:hypothetical protein